MEGERFWLGLSSRHACSGWWVMCLGIDIDTEKKRKNVAVDSSMTLPTNRLPHITTTLASVWIRIQVTT